jgi:dienelactone hydrolase
MEMVLNMNSYDYLKNLIDTESSRRFSADYQAKFESWRQDFLAWLRGLFLNFGVKLPAPGVFDLKIMDEQKCDGFKRIDIQFRNPEFNLIVPGTVLEPVEKNDAGIICQHGHGKFGRLPVIGETSSEEMIEERDKFNYDFGLKFAQAGFTVIAIDLFNFGQRSLPRIGRDKCDVLANFLNLFGINLVALQLSDIRHAISVLSSWNGVDPRRIGMAGLSLGGRMTMFATAFDERIKVAAASGSCNTYRDRIEKLAGACGAQIVPKLLPDADTPEIFSAIAPRPLQLQWGRKDPLIISETAQEGIDYISRCYSASGFPEHFYLDSFEGGHEFDFKPALEWFNKYL